MPTNIDDKELERLDELAGQASKGPFFADGFDVQDDDDNAVARCNSINDLPEEVQEANTHYIAAACNAVPALVAEVRRLREALNKEHRAWQCTDARGDWLEMENAALREKVEAWEWFGECFEVMMSVLRADILNFDGYIEALNSTERAKEEAVHSDRE